MPASFSERRRRRQRTNARSLLATPPLRRIPRRVAWRRTGLPATGVRWEAIDGSGSPHGPSAPETSPGRAGRRPGWAERARRRGGIRRPSGPTPPWRPARTASRARPWRGCRHRCRCGIERPPHRQHVHGGRAPLDRRAEGWVLGQPAVDQEPSVDLDRWVDAGDRGGRQEGGPEVAMAEDDLLASGGVGGDNMERHRRLLERVVGMCVSITSRSPALPAT